MENCIFSMLKEENLTTLKIRYNYKTNKFRFICAKEWEPDLNFAHYNQDFVVDDILTDETIFFHSIEAENLFIHHNLAGYMVEIKRMMEESRHFGLDFYYHHGLDIKFMIGQHNRKLGIFNKSHGIMAGGIRRHQPDMAEMEVIRDGLNLAKAMSYKNIAAGLPAGGCKAVLQMAELDIHNREAMGFIAYALDSCRMMTAPDMNLPAEMSDAMRRLNLSAQFTGGSLSKTGLTGTATAYGLIVSLKAVVEGLEGNPSLKGKKALVIGFGAVGRPVAESLIQEGAELILAVRNPEKARGLTEKFPDAAIRIIPAEDALQYKVDVLCPCGGGNVITFDNVHRLQCRYLWGAANNLFKVASRSEELELARTLKKMGIQYEPEWWHNWGGILCGGEDYYFNGDEESLKLRIEQRVQSNVRQILKQDNETGLTATEICYELCDSILYESGD